MPPTSISRSTRRIAARSLHERCSGSPTRPPEPTTAWRSGSSATSTWRSAGCSDEVEAKIGRHLQRFQTWFHTGLGHDRVSAVTPREIAGWREHLAATVVRPRRDGRAQTMAPATVNNHLAHLSAFFTWTAAHAPAGLLPHGDPTSRVELLRLPAPEPRALSAAQVRTVKNVLDRLEGFPPSLAPT